MNGAILWLAVTIVILTWLLVSSIRSRRYWINACQTQITKRWQESLPVDQGLIAGLLDAHLIRWIPVPDPDRNERMPDVPMHLAECPTCGPLTSITDTSVHQARVLAIHINKGQLRAATEDTEGLSQQPPAEPSATARPAALVHRLEVEISGGHPHGLRGDITFRGVCDAPEGTQCRMWCNDPDCREEAGEEHDRHTIVDQGECGVIETLNADPSMIPELYEGPAGPLRPGFIELTQDTDGVTWRYAEESVTDLQRLVAFGRSLIAHGVSLVDYSDHLTAYHGSLNALAEVLVGLADTPGPSRQDCAADCRHGCPECRLGLGTHLECDPLCAHHIPAVMK